jgi:hypothetical protein
MTLSVPARPAPARRPDAPAPGRRHAGCYWDHLQAAWIAYAAPVPAPRPAAE